MPPDSPIGFAPADWVLFCLTALLLLAALAKRPVIRRRIDSLAQRKYICTALLFCLPIALRLLLLPHHPVPVPDTYDEFSHLMVADTLLHGRLANPPHAMHRFFETFLILQEPSYSSIYPLGPGLTLALGRLLSGTPWTGVLIATGAFCASCYWMLRAWVTPGWALLGGILTVIEFGPLSQWTNSHGGGSLAAMAGCLVFGALPRLRLTARPRDAMLLGAGFAIHMLTRQFESLFLFPAVALFLVPVMARRQERFKLFRVLTYALAALMPAVVLILLQNKAVTHSWTTLPEQLSRYQYGVPAALTVEENALPHMPLTPQQEMDYKAQSLMHGTGADTPAKFFLRLEYRVRYLRFFFLPPLYVALIAFVFALNESRMRWVAATLAIFAIGTNLFPYLLVHNLAGVTCLFVLMSIVGLQQISRIRVRGNSAGKEIAFVLIVLSFGEFLCWYALHLFENPALYPVLRYETWDAINHGNPERRLRVEKQLAAMNEPLLVFVRYSPRHIYRDEWVWNKADIDGSQIVYARDLGPEDDAKLIQYYPKRRVLLLEPDSSVPAVSSYNAH